MNSVSSALSDLSIDVYIDDVIVASKKLFEMHSPPKQNSVSFLGLIGFYRKFIANYSTYP